MRRTLQLIACATAVWLAAPPTATADPIAVTSGVLTLPSPFGGGPITLTGTDGTRMFTFAGTISDIDPAPTSCHPCISQIGIDVSAPGAAHGTLTYGNESYQAGGGFLDTEGVLVLFIQGEPILLPAPLALGGYESQLRGLLASVDAGLSRISRKVGWADLRPYDAGMSGYSAEVMFIRPVGMAWAFDHDVNYVGPGFSYYLYSFRFSRAVVFATGSARRSVVPVASAALVVPLSR